MCNETRQNDTQHNYTQYYETMQDDTQHDDTQHDDTQHDDTQHDGTEYDDTEHKDTRQIKKFRTTIKMDTQHNMLSIDIVNGVMLNVGRPSVVAPIANHQHF